MFVALEALTDVARTSFRELLQKSWATQKTYLDKYGARDARCDFFIIWSETNLWLLIQLDNFSEILDSQTTRISRYMKLTPTDRIQFLLQYDTINRIGYVTKTMFDVEYFLKSISNRLGLETNGKYYNITRALVSHLGMNEQDFKILNAPAQLRNALHNSGFASFNFEVALQGREYKFEEGKKVTFSGWDNIHIMFSELLGTLTNILENVIVQQIPRIEHASESSHYMPNP